MRQDPKQLQANTLELAKIYFASGIDSAKSVVFVQSQVKEHTELMWILTCLSKMGELTRMTQFKDKGKGNDQAGVGLFTYPVLMAADIMLYQTDLVPVGQDQLQHLQLARDLITRFNQRYETTFPIPEPFVAPVGARIQSLTNPSKKMSKSDEDVNGAIFLMDDPKVIEKKIKRAVTDSGSEVRFDQEQPAITNLLTIYQLVAGKTKEECQVLFEGKGYGFLKTELAGEVVKFLEPFQNRYQHSYSDLEVEQILEGGANEARGYATDTMKIVRESVGV